MGEIEEKKYTIEELVYLGYLGGTVNVGIRSLQKLKVGVLVEKGKANSINKFIQEAVQEKLDKFEEEFKDGQT